MVCVESWHTSLVIVCRVYGRVLTRVLPKTTRLKIKLVYNGFSIPISAYIEPLKGFIKWISRSVRPLMSYVFTSDKVTSQFQFLAQQTKYIYTYTKDAIKATDLEGLSIQIRHQQKFVIRNKIVALVKSIALFLRTEGRPASPFPAPCREASQPLSCTLLGG